MFQRTTDKKLASEALPYETRCNEVRGSDRDRLARTVSAHAPPSVQDNPHRRRQSRKSSLKYSKDAFLFTRACALPEQVACVHVCIAVDSERTLLELS